MEKIFTHWIQIFGSPGSLFSDNGGEFNNDLLRELGDLLNSRILTTAAESPWSNGITERHNAMLGGMVEKTMADTNCSLKVAVAWSVSAKNALKNVHGFSPNQLVFGRNPNTPTVIDSAPPALEGVTSSQLIAEHLNALHAARRAYIECEASDKLRRALLKKTRTSTVHNYHTGDQVYYKNRNSKRWHGPGVVIGGINKQVFVKHGGTFLRVNPCNLQHVNWRRAAEPSGHSVNDTRSELSKQESPVEEDDDYFEDSKDLSAHEHESQGIDEHFDIPDENIGIPEQIEHDNVEDVTNDAINEDMTSITNEDVTYDATDQNIMTDTTNENMTSDAANEQNQDNPERDQENSNKVPLALSRLFPYNSAGSKEETLVAVNDDTLSNKETYVEDLPVKGSRIRIKLKDDEWSTANVMTDKIDDVLYLQNETLISQCVNTQEVKDWEYVNEEILAVNTDNCEVLKAKLEEIENLKSHNVFTEVTKEQQPTIDVRWVITEKFKDGQKQTKARLVAKGFQESNDIQKDSPTCLKENLRLVATIAASEKWKIKSLDIKSAFLQGKIIEREAYLTPPPEATNEGNILWRLNKVIYGLSDASRMWYLKVKESLESLGMRMSGYDEALFYKTSDGTLSGLIAVHVDDFLHVGDERFEKSVIQEIKDIFEISQLHDQYFNYLGLEITQSPRCISFSQFDYISKLTLLDGEVTEKEKKSKIGQLAWVAGQTRPDISFDVCQASVSTKNENSETMKRINKCIRRLKAEHLKISFVPMDLKNATIVCFADAAFANMTDGASQGGFIIFLVSGQNCVPLFWQSRKLKRVVKSTLSAETMALMEGAEQCFLLKTILKEILNLDLPIIAFTDSKSLKDCLYTSKTLEDKRLKVDICVLRDYLRQKEIHEVRWIATDEQLADPLTKSGVNPSKLLQVLQSARLSVV